MSPCDWEPGLRAPGDVTVRLHPGCTSPPSPRGLRASAGEEAALARQSGGVWVSSRSRGFIRQKSEAGWLLMKPHFRFQEMDSRKDQLETGAGAVRSGDCPSQFDRGPGPLEMLCW